MARVASRGRRSAWTAGALCAVFLGSLVSARAAEPTGAALTGLHPFDREILGLMDKWDIPGGSLAVAYKGRLVLARGYGIIDRSSRAPAQPTTLYRLGSLAKPITAIAVLQLVEQGRIGLDDPILPILGELAPPESRIADSRVKAITVRQLLQHRWGMDRNISGDGPFMPYSAAAAARQKAPMPASCVTLLRDALERKLDFAPGERFAYSNVGYCMLGRIVERVSGESYETFVQTHLFAPSGAHGFRLARTLETAPGEATYYDYPGAPRMDGMPGVANTKVNAPYGGYSLEMMDAFGGWVASPVDVLRFFLAIDGQRGGPLLGEAVRREMVRRPKGDEKSVHYYALGIEVRPVQGGINWWHTGGQHGLRAFALRTAGGYAWVATFNMRPKDNAAFQRDLDQGLWRAARAVKTWPSGDLFAQFP